MAQISVKNVTFSYEGSMDTIFETVSFVLDTNWKLGFIGRNGKGKTTFFNLLMGRLSYHGRIDTNVTFDLFPYSIAEWQMELPAGEFVSELKQGCEDWRVIRELNLLGQDPEILYRPFKTLSFGERTKVLLAVLFSGDNQFLLIDEPTNHLDRETKEVVKAYLRSKKGFILVSHDRDLLDACTDHCLVLNRSSIEVQAGNFSTWWENKQKKDQFVLSENEKHLKEIGKLKQAAKRTADWADKNERTKIGFDPIKEHDRFLDTRSYIGAKTKKMQSRVKQMEKRIEREIEEKEGLLKDVEEPQDLKLVVLAHHKETLILGRDYGVTYSGGNHPVFQNLNFELKQGERVALSGKNGCGKSTLIKRILEKCNMPDAFMEASEQGILETASGLIISYVGQDSGGLSGKLSDYCKEHNLDRSLFLAILRKLDFERSQFEKPMEEYSEGQKKKVLLATSLATPAHLYIWDEPLNYIDVYSRMQIEDLVLTYHPTLLFVEHDSRFCEKIATKQILL